MRCLNMLANCHYGPGQTQKAIPLWEELLELNPSDNQGIRYVLLPALLEVKDLKKFQKYRKQFNEGTSMMTYSDALYSFMKAGATKEARITLQTAFRQNKHVPPLMLATYPPDAYPGGYSLGSKEEALVYMEHAWRAWHWAEGAVEWMRKEWHEHGSDA